MQVHEIGRSALLDLLNHGRLEPYTDERPLCADGCDWLVVHCYCRFFNPLIYSNTSVRIYAAWADKELALNSCKLNEEWALTEGKDYHLGEEFEVWHIVDDELNDDDVYVCYSVVPFLSEQTEDGFEGCAGEIEFEDYEQALHCAKRLVNIQNPEGYKGIPYQTKMFHHVALTREITDFTNDLREEKTLCVLMPRMNRKYLGKEILGCAVNLYEEHDLEISESLRQLREAAVM